MVHCMSVKKTVFRVRTPCVIRALCAMYKVYGHVPYVWFFVSPCRFVSAVYMHSVYSLYERIAL